MYTPLTPQGIHNICQ